MQAGVAAGSEPQFLSLDNEAFGLDSYGVGTQGKVVEAKLAGAVAGGGLGGVGVLQLHGDRRALDGAMLRVVDEAGDGTEDACPSYA